MLFLLACVKYPDFAAHRREVPDEPIPPLALRDLPRTEEIPTSEFSTPESGDTPTSAPPALDVSTSPWTLYYSAPDGQYAYEVEFLEDGVAMLHNPADTTKDNDGWGQDGAVVTLSMNDGFVEYRGVFTDLNLVRGTASNAEDTWGFALIRQAPGATKIQAPDELPEDGYLRADLAGTSWRLEDLDPDQPVDLELTFNHDGTLEVTLPTEFNTWKASDGVVHFWVNDMAVEHVAVATWPDQMFGIATNEDGNSWAFHLRKR
ncbi:MAG TPA: hypothetical protein QGF58_16545 [Myxococcota bacterium]|nr:hypothetical protein [Myxococcota bacterium]